MTPWSAWWASLCGICLTEFLSCAMPAPQKGFHSVGAYSINVVEDKTSNTQRPSFIELRAEGSVFFFFLYEYAAK